MLHARAPAVEGEAVRLARLKLHGQGLTVNRAKFPALSIVEIRRGAAEKSLEISPKILQIFSVRL
jgi:hypothetical protein